MSLKDIVNVQISRETKQVSRKSFGIPLILGTHKAFTSLVQTFSSLEEVGLVFTTTDKVYIAAAAFFSQSPSILKLKVARRATSDVTTVAVSTVANSTAYSITLNGTVFTFTSDSSATAIEIAAGLVAAINAGSVPVTAAAVGDGTYTLTADVASVPYSVKLDSRQTATFSTSGTIAADIDAISVEDSEWYALVCTSRTDADIQSIALKIETMQKIYVSTTGDANVVNTSVSSDTTTTAAILKASGAARTSLIFSAYSATQFPECALLGKILPLDPGSWTAQFKTLAGITVDVPTSTQRTNALGKNVSIYTEVGGVSIVEGGKVCEGEYLDVIVFIDYLQARITEKIYAVLVNQPKVPFTDAGIALIQSEINSVLQDGVSLGGLTTSPPYTITVPKASDVSVADKGARTLNNVKFSATLAGAIHAVTVQGTVSL